MELQLLQLLWRSLGHAFSNPQNPIIHCDLHRWQGVDFV